MDKNVHLAILEAIATQTPFDIDVISAFYDHYKSYDLLVTACEYCRQMGYVSLGLPTAQELASLITLPELEESGYDCVPVASENSDSSQPVFWICRNPHCVEAMAGRAGGLLYVDTPIYKCPHCGRLVDHFRFQLAQRKRYRYETR